jgi:hypothetical protein
MKIKLNALFLEINLKKILYNKDIMRNINFLIEGNYFFSKIRDIFSFCFFYIYHYNKFILFYELKSISKKYYFNKFKSFLFIINV